MRNNRLPKGPMLSLGIVVVLLAATLEGLSKPTSRPHDSANRVLRFDAVLELNAPMLKTHVVLFSRYWVAADHYTAAIVWAEPHEGPINFPGYPISLVIHSNRDRFEISHQVHKSLNVVFEKPLGQRPSFRHRFNAYDLMDIRFAEADAIASRVYRDDLGALPEQGDHSFDVKIAQGHDAAKRQIARISGCASDDRVRELQLRSTDDVLLKELHYDYPSRGKRHIVCKQDVNIPSTLLMAGMTAGSMTIRINDQPRVLKEFPVSQHIGGRRVTIDWRSLDLAGRAVGVPGSIVVRRTTDDALLRSARLFNFVCCSQDAAQCREDATRFAHLTEDEERCRQMLLKYWLKDPADVNEADLEVLKGLRAALRRQSGADPSPALCLKNLNKSFELDWMLGESKSLRKHYREYLNTLIRAKLDRMVLFGGWNAIETTVRWGMFRSANEMLEKWVDTVVGIHSVDSVLCYIHAQCDRGRLWSVVALTESLKKKTRKTDELFKIEVLRCKALSSLSGSLEQAEKLESNYAIMQAGWVASQVRQPELQSMARRSLEQAARLYSQLKQPTEAQQQFRRQLDAMVGPGRLEPEKPAR